MQRAGGHRSWVGLELPPPLLVFHRVAPQGLATQASVSPSSPSWAFLSPRAPSSRGHQLHLLGATMGPDQRTGSSNAYVPTTAYQVDFSWCLSRQRHLMGTYSISCKSLRMPEDGGHTHFISHPPSATPRESLSPLTPVSSLPMSSTGMRDLEVEEEQSKSQPS